MVRNYFTICGFLFSNVCVCPHLYSCLQYLLQNTSYRLNWQCISSSQITYSMSVLSLILIQSNYLQFLVRRPCVFCCQFFDSLATSVHSSYYSSHLSHLLPQVTSFVSLFSFTGCPQMTIVSNNQKRMFIQYSIQEPMNPHFITSDSIPIHFDRPCLFPGYLGKIRLIF